jgi:hypothetical protein
MGGGKASSCPLVARGFEWSAFEDEAAMEDLAVANGRAFGADSPPSMAAPACSSSIATFPEPQRPSHVRGWRILLERPADLHLAAAHGPGH